MRYLKNLCTFKLEEDGKYKIIQNFFTKTNAKYFRHWYKDNVCKQSDIAAFEAQRAQQGRVAALTLHPGTNNRSK